ncbi:MAG: hypothetical protein V4672_18800 [Verrucomicrobiota bacterium]
MMAKKSIGTAVAKVAVKRARRAAARLPEGGPGDAAEVAAGEGTGRGRKGEAVAAGAGRPFEAGALPAGFEGWLAGAQALGLGPGEMVWELHVVQGRSVRETARLLGLAAGEVAALRGEMRTRAVERAPRSEGDFQAVREELRERLVAILEDACRAPEDPRLLAVRQRVCDQLAELYGLKMQRRSGGEEPVQRYALPEEMSAAVEARVNDLFGRAAEIEAARKAVVF